MAMYNEFLQWSAKHGGFGCEEAAFEAGWEAANTKTTHAEIAELIARKCFPSRDVFIPPSADCMEKWIQQLRQ